MEWVMQESSCSGLPCACLQLGVDMPIMFLPAVTCKFSSSSTSPIWLGPFFWALPWTCNCLHVHAASFLLWILWSKPGVGPDPRWPDSWNWIWPCLILIGSGYIPCCFGEEPVVPLPAECLGTVSPQSFFWEGGEECDNSLFPLPWYHRHRHCHS